MPCVPDLCRVTALHVLGALGCSENQPVTPVNGPMPEDHHLFPCLLPVPCRPQVGSEKRTGSPEDKEGTGLIKRVSMFSSPKTQPKKSTAMPIIHNTKK